MQVPTTIEIRNAIEVLEKLSERINKNAARSLSQIPPCYGAGEVAGEISANSMEQNKQIQSITGLLQTWNTELERKQKRNVSIHV